MFEDPLQTASAVEWLKEKRVAVLFQPSDNAGRVWAAWIWDKEIRRSTLSDLVAAMKREWRAMNKQVVDLRWRRCQEREEMTMAAKKRPTVKKPDTTKPVKQAVAIAYEKAGHGSAKKKGKAKR